MTADATSPEGNDPPKSGLLISRQRFPRAQDHGIFNLYPTQRNSGKAPTTTPTTQRSGDAQ